MIMGFWDLQVGQDHTVVTSFWCSWRRDGREDYGLMVIRKRERLDSTGERGCKRKVKNASALGGKMDTHTVYRREQKQTKQVTFTPRADAYLPFFHTPLPLCSLAPLRYQSTSVHSPLARRAANCIKMMSRRCGFALPVNPKNPESYYCYHFLCMFLFCPSLSHTL